MENTGADNARRELGRNLLGRNRGASVGKSTAEAEGLELAPPPPNPRDVTARDLGLGISDLEKRRDGLANAIRTCDDELKMIELAKHQKQEERENLSKLLQVVQLEIRVISAELSKVSR